MGHSESNEVERRIYFNLRGMTFEMSLALAALSTLKGANTQIINKPRPQRPNQRVIQRAVKRSEESFEIKQNANSRSFLLMNPLLKGLFPYLAAIKSANHVCFDQFSLPFTFTRSPSFF